MKKLIVGLTGGIGSGKSAARRVFRALGVPTADADAVVRRALEPGGTAYRRVKSLFGPGAVRPGGALDRGRIAAVVFRRPVLRRKLEKILHPLVVKEFRARIRRHRRGPLVLEIPLLFEAGLRGLVDGVLVVWAPRAARLRRLAKDGRFSRGEILRRMRAQMPLETKRKRADWVIDNSRGPAALKPQVKALLTAWK